VQCTSHHILVARKNLQAARVIENSGKKRARDKDTIRRYFTASRNFDVLSGSMEIDAVPVNRDQVTPSTTAADSTLELLQVSGSPAFVDALSRVGSADGTSSDVEILAVSAPSITMSTDSSTAWLSEDDPVCGATDDDSEEEEFPDLPPIPKRTKRNYDLTRRFQMEWAATCPWSEMILTDEGLLHMVKCSICSAVKGRAVIMGPKFDIVKRHAKRVGHLKNTELYASRRPTTVLQQIQGCTTLESRKKVSSLLMMQLCMLSSML
jgi:hypothetical protein